MRELSANCDFGNHTTEKLVELMNPCVLCPRKCKVYRSKGQKGFCGVTDKLIVSSVSPHFGEESVLVGGGGSGTIFFTGCNLGCIFCQNFDISHFRQGHEITIEQLTEYMLDLQKNKCSNINLVTPTHFIPAIIAAIELARKRGLNLPIVYNCGGYDSVETLKLIEGFIDIYMPDMKYSEPDTAKELSDAFDYPEANFAAIREMYRQVGELKINNGLAKRGLLVRHLVLPNQLAGSFKTIDFLANEISSRTAINIMDQYRPCFKASSYNSMNRRPTQNEVESVLQYAIERGLKIIT
ncbi:MAG: radical SAM protein [Planctomycetota bacterium]|jgi:putative pyruvate formate lyase activating enzyme